VLRRLKTLEIVVDSGEHMDFSVVTQISHDAGLAPILYTG
jgi:hypothetical protein